MPKLRLGVLISGRGSNLMALIKACQQPFYGAEIAVVISNNPEAGGLQRAQEAGIPAYFCPDDGKPAFAIAVGQTFIKKNVDLTVLAGFMSILWEPFVERWHGRIVNIHPSLLPDFPGLHPHRQALAAHRLFSGCTVHWVVPEVDAGPIIAQSVVPVLNNDTEDTLSSRILIAEHKLYPLVIDHIARKIYMEKYGTI